MPSPVIKSKTPKMMNFSEAISAILEGSKVTRVEWDDKRWYCFLKDEMLQIHKSGEKADKSHAWIINIGDLNATDWIEIAKNN